MNNRRGTVHSASGGTIKRFRETIRAFYRTQGRDLPWRRTRDPYRILVSEIMLQQTQVERVMGKYEAFLTRFPDLSNLAASPLRDVLSSWQGLGYNRRAVALHRAARLVIATEKGLIPATPPALSLLPGVGRYTAAAVSVFAFGGREVFIETNIRRVFLHFFFPDQEQVTDAEILALVERTLPKQKLREWYYGLMDYGSALKPGTQNPNRRSAHYRRQTAFKGSRRQLRGRVLREILASQQITCLALARRLKTDAETVREILTELKGEGFVKECGRGYGID